MMTNFPARKLSASPRFAALLLSLALLLLSSLALAAKPKADELPSSVSEWVRQTEAALRDQDNAALSALAITKETLAWYGSQSRQANWKVAVVKTQGTGGGGQGTGTAHQPAYLAIFYDYHDVQSIGDHVHILIETSDGWRIGPEILETDTRGYRVRDHRLTVRYDLPKSGCRITDDVTIERTGAQEIFCLLRLSADMKVDRIEHRSKPFAARIAPGLLVFEPPAGMRTFTLSLAYHGTVNHEWDYILPTEAILVSYWYPHIARLPARHSVTVTVPKGWTAVGQGRLVRRTTGRDGTTFTFRHEIPTCFFSLDAGPYVITTRKLGGRRLSAYLLKPDEGRARHALDSLARALPIYEKWFGPFPYDHYEIVETAGPMSGALEAYSFATFGRGSLGAVEHELSHTWWGGIVPNPYTRTMWNESFASYSEGLLERQLRKERPSRAVSGLHQQEQGSAAPSDYGREALQTYAVPISAAFDTNVHSAVGYGKGSLVLRMLEDLLGTEKMIRCMRRFRDDQRPGEAADWPDFQRVVQRVTGGDWRWFFAQWLDRGGVPILSLANVLCVQKKGVWSVQADILQEGAPYRLRLPLTLDLHGGKTIRLNCDVNSSKTTIHIDAPTPPRVLRLDPDGNILLAGAKTDKEKDDPLSYRFAP